MAIERIDIKLRSQYKKEYPDRDILYSKTLNHFEGHYVDWLESKLSGSQNSSTSDEALPISDVVGQSEQVKCPYCKRDKPCKGSYPEGCFHPNSKGI